MNSVVTFDRSRHLFAAACNEIAGGVNSNVRLGNNPVPLFFARALGAHLTDVDGNDYVDYALGMGPVGTKWESEPGFTFHVDSRLGAFLAAKRTEAGSAEDDDQ